MNIASIRFTLPENDLYIPSGSIKTYNITTSMSPVSNLPVAELIAVVSGNNVFKFLKRGTLVNIDFLVYADADVAEVAASIPMRISTINRLSTDGYVIGDVIDIKLIHSLYYKNIITNKAWGSSASNIGTIFKDVIAVDFPEYLDKSFISTTYDHTNIRYQLEENSLNFLRRIQKYGIIQEFPVYSYIDAKDNLYLKGIYECYSETFEDTIEVLPVYDMVLLEHTKDSLDISRNILKASDHRIYEDITSSSIATRVDFTNKNFKSLDQNSAINYKIYRSFEVVNNAEATSNMSITHQDWNLTPSDAQAIASKQIFEKNINTTSASLVFNNNAYLDELLIGKVIKLTLISEALINQQTDKITTEATNTGYYLIWQSSYILDEEGTFKQELQLTRLR